MKNKLFQSLHIIKISIFAAILVLPTLIWLTIGLVSSETQEELIGGMNENRELAKFPEKFDAKTITAELEAYYNDHLPFRTRIIAFYHDKNSKLEKIYTANISPKLSKFLYGEAEAEEEEMTDYTIDDFFATNSENGQTNEANTETSGNKQEKHNYVETGRTAPTCLREGAIVYTCSDCGESYTKTIPANGHNNIFAGYVEPTYTEYGCNMYFCDICHYITKTDIEGKLIDTNYLAPTVFNNCVVLGRFDWLFYSSEDCISYYQGTNCLTNDALKDYANTVNELKTLCDQKGIELEVMIVPNKSQVYSEYMPTYPIEEGPKRIDRLVDYLNKNTEISVVYPMKELQATKPYWSVYYSLDTHWNRVGSFIGVQALYKQLGIPTTNIFSMELTEDQRTSGDLMILAAADTGVNGIVDTEYTFNYKPEIAITEASGDPNSNIVYRCKSTSTNEKKLVMISDSFRINTIPYLSKDFAECCIAHRDDIDEVKDDIRSADVLVMACVERYDDELLQSMKKTIEILKQ